MNRTIALLIVSVLISCGSLFAQDKPDQQQKGTFVHTVFFWLDNPESADDHASLLEGLTELSKIPDILYGYVGVPAPTDREVIDSSYNFSMTFIFKDAADQDAYQIHPDHVRFVEYYSHLWSKVVVYDAVQAHMSPDTDSYPDR